jgi:hypothetical protein
MYDVAKLKTPEDCRTVLQRAREKNLRDVYNAVFRRFCELVGAELTTESKIPADLR